MGSGDSGGHGEAARTISLRGPLIAFTLGLVVFGAASWDRLLTPSHDNHYVHLADAMLHGRLHLEGEPPHRNDWARHDGKWFVSFPPLPAVLMLPGVALWGMKFNDRLFTLPFAAAGPALLLLLLNLLATRGRIDRGARERWLLTTLYGVGTVYFFCAAQGSVWYTAHIVGGVMLLLFLLFAADARRPLLAGLFLALAFACRPPMLLCGAFLLFELSRIPRGEALRRTVLAALPLALVLGGLMAMNHARFGDPFEFGHRHLVVIQSARIEQWGLFSVHYLGRNLAALLASVPWLTAEAPHVKISLHGLALWVTTPALLWILWPSRPGRDFTAVAVTAALVALPSLFYQNTGWVQFGQRFSLDYAPLLVLLLAIGNRRFGRLFVAAVAISVAVNLFGAATFDRAPRFYAGGKDRHAIFPPD
ncbi:MAG TPA: hypothetical protein VM389_02405 [Phycisphaerae bacterium]|nr:hypothetical protein [Phycisphaerae bacterium]